MKVTIGVSNRHVHLTKDDYKILFDDLEFTVYKKINQPGQFASNRVVTLVNNDKVIENVRVVGPFRDYTQVEISKSDAKLLNLNPPVRSSGDLKESSPITIKGPNGIINLKEGCIIADRHIHITNEEVIKYELQNVKKVSVLVNNNLIDNVYLKIAPNSYFEMHIDKDDSNTYSIKTGDIGTIIK